MRAADRVLNAFLCLLNSDAFFFICIKLFIILILNISLTLMFPVFIFKLILPANNQS